MSSSNISTQRIDRRIPGRMFAVSLPMPEQSLEGIGIGVLRTHGPDLRQ